MVKRLAIALGCVWLCVFAAQTARADEPPGAKLYATYCAACHGAGGKGGFAPALGDEKYLDSHNDDVIAQITGAGIVAKGMPAWSKAKGGTLTDSQIADIVAYLRALFATSVADPVPTSVPVVATVDFAQTKMALTQSTNAQGGVMVNAFLHRNDGSPVVGASLAFVRTTVLGEMELGTIKTNRSGNATLFLDSVPEAARVVNVNFKGDRNLGSSAGKIALQAPVIPSSAEMPDLSHVRLSIGDEPLLPPEGSLITPNPPLLPSAIFLSVVGGVWVLYAFVISQVVGIWKNGQNISRENTLGRKGR